MIIPSYKLIARHCRLDIGLTSPTYLSPFDAIDTNLYVTRTGMKKTLEAMIVARKG